MTTRERKGPRDADVALPAGMMPPRATVRLQMHAAFTLDDAHDCIDYYAGLGISHYYLSPIFTSREGSTHGYDIVDFSSVNPALGGEAALHRLVDGLRQAGMGLVIDIVPNHMGVDARQNAWWRDVLVHGRQSRHAQTFDIDWEAPGCDGRLLLPILGDQFGQVLRAGEISLVYVAERSGFELAYFDHRLPLSEVSLNELRADAGPDEDGVAHVLARHDARTDTGLQALGRLIDAQHYRLAWWRTAADEINWRRFFEISDLVGLRIERTEVFEATHALVFDLYRQGLIDGVRIDHIDGLADPTGYLRNLRERLTLLHGQRPTALRAGKPWIIVEKILAVDETLPADWPVDGTTGYDHMNDVLRLLHDPRGETALSALWNLSIGRNDDFDTEQRQARRQILTENLVSEFQTLVRRLHALAQSDPLTRDVTAAMIERALGAFLEFFPVYRTYITTPGTRSLQDIAVFEHTLIRARSALRAADQPALELIEGWLGARALPNGAGRQQQLAIAKFQQLTSPLAAKAVEDTAFYRYNRLISLNEVGGDPAVFSLDLEEFHERLARGARMFPDRVLTLATHDHKRGAIVRARLAVLSELPMLWAETLSDWRQQAAVLRVRCDDHPAPGVADEFALYQMLVGAWPGSLEPSDQAGVDALLERVAAWQSKALREAKQRTSWVAPNEAYEQACRDYLMGLRRIDVEGDSLLERVAEFAHMLASAGALNSLTQMLITLTAPGVPDIYQGSEWWDFTLVDPDNRSEVDMSARRSALTENLTMRDLLPSWRDGRIKQALVRDVLACRKALPAAFSQGRYVPLPVVGEHAQRVVAFARTHRDGLVMVVAARLSARWLLPDLPQVAPASWGDTRVVLPATLREVRWYSKLDGQGVVQAADAVPVSQVLAHLPVALLTDRQPRHSSQVATAQASAPASKRRSAVAGVAPGARAAPDAATTAPEE